MGVDLTLLPLDYENDNGGSAFSRLMLERRRELWDDIAKLPVNPIAKVTGYMGDNFGDETEDCYGEPLKYVFAKDLAELRDHEAVQDNDLNRAIWAFLAAIRPETKIVLYWH